MTNKTNMIRNARNGLASLLVGATALTSNLNAQESLNLEKAPSYNNGYVETGIHSMYLGTYAFSMSKNEVETLAAGVNLGKGLEASVFANYDKSSGLNELDFTLSGNFSLGKHLELQPSAMYFTFPSVNGAEEAATLALGVQIKNLPKYLPNVKLFATQAFGEQSEHGQLFQVILSKDFTIPHTDNKLSLNLTSRSTYNNHYFVKGSGFTAVSGEASLNYDFGKGVSASLGARAHKAFDSIGGTFKDDHVFELSLKKKF